MGGSEVTDDKWECYPFDEWKHDLSIGWYNPEDDAATPTEDALLEEIKDLRHTDYRVQYLETTNELYRTQIAYLISELHRIGWTSYPPEARR